MKRLNEYKRLVKGTFAKMLNDIIEGNREFNVINSYSYSDYNDGDCSKQNFKINKEYAQELIKDLGMFSFINLVVTNQGTLKIQYHSNKFMEIEEIEVSKKEVIEIKETIQEIVLEVSTEEPKQVINLIETIKPIQTTINREIARKAFYWTSFNPDERGKSIIYSTNKEINTFLEEVVKINPEAAEEIFKDVKEWALKYDNKKISWLNAMSRCASSMITGPANFPVEKNRKRNAVADTRNSEIIEFYKKSKKSFIKKYSPIIVSKTIFEEVQEIVTADRKGYFKQLDKESLTAKLYNHGSMSKENLEEVKEIVLKETGLFTSKHKIHRIIENLEKKFDRIIKGTANKEIEINGIKIVDSEENNRIEIYFDCKPSENVRKHLKSKGFKWAPSKGSWQNFRNQLRLQDIKKYFENN